MDSSPPESPKKGHVPDSSRASFNLGPASPVAESRRSFKKDKEVDKLRKRISELENERRTIEKKHQKRLHDRESELQLAHAEEQERVSRQYKDERERAKRDQREELEAARTRLRDQVKQDVRQELQAEFQQKLDKEVAEAKETLLKNAEKQQ